MANNYTRIYIVRHGQTDWNVKRLLQGFTDIPLNVTGEQQAKEAGDKFKHVDFAAAYSSDLARAKRTAEIIALEKKIAVEATEVLRERNFGKYEGSSLDGIREDFIKDMERLNTLTQEEIAKDPVLKNLESDDKVFSRLITFLREIAVAHSGKNVLVVSHGGALRLLLVKLGWAEHHQLPSGSIKNTAHAVIESDGIDFFVKETEGINKVD